MAIWTSWISIRRWPGERTKGARRSWENGEAPDHRATLTGDLNIPGSGPLDVANCRAEQDHHGPIARDTRLADDRHRNLHEVHELRSYRAVQLQGCLPTGVTNGGDARCGQSEPSDAGVPVWPVSERAIGPMSVRVRPSERPTSFDHPQGIFT